MREMRDAWISESSQPTQHATYSLSEANMLAVAFSMAFCFCYGRAYRFYRRHIFRDAELPPQKERGHCLPKPLILSHHGDAEKAEAGSAQPTPGGYCHASEKGKLWEAMLSARRQGAKGN